MRFVLMLLILPISKYLSILNSRYDLAYLFESVES